jgi:hypothetical protein
MVTLDAVFAHMSTEWTILNEFIPEELYPGDHLFLAATLMPRPHADVV